MEAPIYRAAILAAALASMAASYRTQNFVVHAPNDEVAQQVGAAAERYRRELAVEWLGKTLPNWSQPCPITVEVAEHLGAGGATSFVFNQGEVFGWQMNIQGPLERVLDSVLPHEVTHTIFATYFRRPLPRWADEGSCTTVEHPAERVKQQRMLVAFLRTGRGIPFSQMFAMREYPHDILPLYAQGHSLASFLMAQGGKKKFLAYLTEGLEKEHWVEATHEHYGYENLAMLQDAWLDWVKQGSPNIDQRDPAAGLVSKPAGRTRPAPNLVVRAQSADPPEIRAPLHTAVLGAAIPQPEEIEPVAPPPAPARGWYAVSKKKLGATPPPPPSAPRAGETSDAGGATGSGQVILEWSKSKALPASAKAAAEPVSQASVYDARLSALDTLRR